MLNGELCLPGRAGPADALDDLSLTFAGRRHRATPECGSHRGRDPFVHAVHGDPSARSASQSAISVRRNDVALAAGDNPERLVRERPLASLSGVRPVQASRAKIHPHRLNRGGDRQANAALWRITLVRLHCHPTLLTAVMAPFSLPPLAI